MSPGYDHWKTTEPDDGYRKEPCDYCGGTGVVRAVTHWRGAVIDGEQECPECGGEGRIVIGPDGLPDKPKQIEPEVTQRVLPSRRESRSQSDVSRDEAGQPLTGNLSPEEQARRAAIWAELEAEQKPRSHPRPCRYAEAVMTSPFCIRTHARMAMKAIESATRYAAALRAEDPTEDAHEHRYAAAQLRNAADELAREAKAIEGTIALRRTAAWIDRRIAS